MDEKIFTGYIILNYRNGSFRAMKRLPKHLKEVDIPIEIKLKVSIPETPRMKVEGEIELSTTKVKQLILEALESGDIK